MLVYDITVRQTFENLEYWLKETRKHCSLDVIIFLVGNQLDLVESRKEERQVTVDEAKALAEVHNLHGFMETSAKSGHQVNAAFTEFAKELIARGDSVRYASFNTSLLVAHPSPTKRKKCCKR